jgi:hypothetical protein
MSEIVEYPYKLKSSFVVRALLLTGFAGLMMVAFAKYRHASLTIDGVITLGPEGARLLYLAIAIICAGFLAVTAFLVARSFTIEHRLVISADRITVPNFVSRSGRSTADIAAISRIYILTLHSTRTLVVKSGAKPLHVSESMLPVGITLEDIRAEIIRRGRSLQQPSSTLWQEL